MRDLMFAFLWAALLPLSMLSAFIGVLLWVWVALLSPNELLYSFMAGVPFNKIVAIITLTIVFLKNKKNHFYFDTTSALLVLLALTATVSWYGAIDGVPGDTELYQKILKDIRCVAEVGWRTC